MLRMALVIATLSMLGFGGGNAIFPQLYTDSVDVYHWVTAAEFSRYFALARLGPGPGTTITALIGYSVAGFPGAALAAFAMFFPAAIIVFAVVAIYDRFHDHPWRKIFARAMIPVVLGLTWVGVTLLSRGALETPLSYALAAGAAAAILWTRVNASLVILAAAVVGVVFLR
jgi:chromate transporter